MRDWVTRVRDTHYVLGSVLGPHPFPTLVRDFQRVIGVEARAQFAGTVGGLADVLVARRFERLQGRVPVRRRGHVVIAGAGNVGLRVAGILAEHDERVVLIERNGSSRNVNALRAAGHHVIVADASVAETLDLAGLVDAKIVLALTDSDATNLQVALAVRQRTDAAVVVRLASAELSRHVLDRQDALAASSVAIASEAFARAALDACEPLRVRRSGRP